MNMVKVLMKEADRRDYHYWQDTYNYTHIPARPGCQYSVVTEVKNNIEMELEVFGEVDPIELYKEKEFYIDAPHLADAEGMDAVLNPYGPSLL